MLLQTCALAAVFASFTWAAVPVSLAPSVASPALAGTVVTWTASATGPGTLWYRYRVRPDGGSFRMVRDYGPENVLKWTGGAREGLYEIEVTVENRETGETGVATAPFQIASRVTGNTPVISRTALPLVFLYSAPPCEAGSRMRVEFGRDGQDPARTPWQECRAGVSLNFYLAGFVPETQYTVRHAIEGGGGTAAGPALTLTAPAVGMPVPVAVSKPFDGQAPSGVLLHGVLFNAPVATDLAGNLIWYSQEPLSFLTRPVRGGGYWGILQALFGPPPQQLLREYDLADNVVRETNAGRINDQLVARGIRPITSFDHDASSLPNGKVLVLASTEQVVYDVQGPGAVDVIGSMVLVLDQDLQVEWAWDAFDHLDVSRKATLGETCTPGTGGCPPFVLAPQGNDWLHANSLEFTPDGNLLLSLRHQDWIIKINYNDGAGDGAIIWRIGSDGDFQITSSDLSPWFSHAHDTKLNSDSTLTLFDNGNVRNAADPSANSRGQVLRIDESSRQAELVVNVDMGAFSFALGSAQRLPDGGYHFNAGWMFDGTARYVEASRSGEIVYAIDVGTPVYRSFRMSDLYAP